MVQLSLAIENYTMPRSLAHYHIMQSLFGTHFDQTDINSILHHRGARRGGVEISLVSPSGTKSLLLPHRERDFVNTGSLSWPFLSVLHWGENPVGQWNITVNFNSTEGHIRLWGLNMTIYGTAELAAEAVYSGECSEMCRARCASGLASSYCDTCRDFRESDTLNCVDSCNPATHETHGKYCVPRQPTTTSTVPTHHHNRTTIVYISPQQVSETNTAIVFPSRTVSSTHHNFSLSGLPGLKHLQQQVHTGSISVSSLLPLHPVATGNSASPSHNRYDVMMTSPLLRPTPVVRLSTNIHSTNPNSDKDTHSATCAATNSYVTHLHTTCLLALLLTSCLVT